MVPGEEAVFVFSPDAESHAIILQHYGDWPAVTASWPGDVSVELKFGGGRCDEKNMILTKL